MNGKVSKKILVVDDDDFIRECCSDVLAAAGYCVDVASNGMEALEKLNLSVYDLVLSDVNMPVAGGIELFLGVEKEHRYLKDRFLFMTSMPPEEPEVKVVLERMGNRLMRKPFSMRDLLKSIEFITKVSLDEQFSQPGLKRDKRFTCEKECYLHNHSILAAKTEDISSCGMRIKYSGVPLAPGSRVSVNIRDRQVERPAEIVWSRSFKGFTRAGLRLIEPLSVESILEGAAGLS